MHRFHGSHLKKWLFLYSQLYKGGINYAITFYSKSEQILDPQQKKMF